MTLRRFGLSLLSIAVVSSFFLAPPAFPQGETTSAIIGQVNDESGAAVPSASVKLTNRENGLKRSAVTDASGRFNFPQLMPGSYSVHVEAQGFEPQENNSVIAGLGQKQTVLFTMKVARSIQSVEVSSEAAILNPEDANTSTTLECTGAGESSQSWRRSNLSIAVCRGRVDQHGGQRQRLRRGNQRLRQCGV